MRSANASASGKIVSRVRRVATAFLRGLRPSVGLMILVGVWFAAGCQTEPSESPQLDVELSLEPSPPVVGNADATVQLTDPQGKPVEGADVRLEGNMNHAGMKPTFADLEEVKPGQYKGELKLTMGGDWFVLVTGKTAQGDRFQHKIDVPGVKSK